MTIDIESLLDAVAASAAFDHHVHHAAVVCYHWVEGHVVHFVVVGVTGAISYIRMKL